MSTKHVQLVQSFYSHTPWLHSSLRVDTSRRRHAPALKVKDFKTDTKQLVELFNPSLETVLKTELKQDQTIYNWLPLKVEFDQCKKYHGYMLLSAPWKIEKNRLILKLPTLDKKLRDEQARFRREIYKNQELFEWESFLHVKLWRKNIDCQHKEVLWKVSIQNHFEMPTILMPLVKRILY